MSSQQQVYTEWAYEQVHPYCRCGRQMERPEELSRPEVRIAFVTCACGEVSQAVFWKQQMHIDPRLAIKPNAWRGRGYVISG